MGDSSNIGRSSRQVPPAMREAVVARDRGCSFPGCYEEGPKLELHHIVEWRHGGETRVENLTLLCKEHHRLLHLSAWELRMHLGTPMFIPPAYIDPDRKPRPNLFFRLPTTHPHLWSDEAVALFTRLDERRRERTGQQ